MQNDNQLLRLRNIANQPKSALDEADEDTAYSNSWPFDPTVVDEEKARRLMRLWAARTLRAARVHYREAITLRNLNVWLTTINAALSILILFLTNAGWFQQWSGIGWLSAAKPEEGPITIYTVLVSVLALLLVFTTIWQYILRMSERSGEHRRGGAEFSNLQRKIERYCIAKTLNMSMIHNINREFNHITKSYPLVKPEKWNKYEKELSQFITELEVEIRYDWREQA